MNDSPLKIGALLFRLFLISLGVAFVAAPMLPAGWSVACDASGAAIMFDRGHGAWMPLRLAWGTFGWAKIPFSFRIMLPLLIAGLCFWPEKSNTTSAKKPIRFDPRLHLVLAMFAIGVGLLFAFFEVSLRANRTFGDGSSLLAEILRGGFVFPAEVLTMHLFNTIRELLMVATGGGVFPILTPLIAVCGAGAVFIWASAVFALLVGCDRIEQAFLFCGPVFAGGLAQFFGYIETTFLVLAGMALFFAAAAWMLAGQGSPARRRRMMLVYAAASIAMLAHAAGVVLLPALLALTLCIDETRRGPRRIAALFDPWAAIGFVAIIVIPYFFLVIEPFFIERGSFGNLRGGADAFNFVPWNYESARPVSSYVYYGMLSWRHAADIGSGFLVGAPVAIPLVLISLRGLRRLEFKDGALLTVAVLTAASAVLIPLVWQFDFAAWGDWNIVTAYLYPLNVLAWLMIVMARRTVALPARSLLFPALITQFAMGLGIMLQLY